jgi:3-hydroxy-9,10-secoandrosta-1,3,5(10)-triene-9,17-dione monooxygenase reductase component
MIDRDLKRALGHMTHGVQVVACAEAGVVRGFTCTWVCQVSFEEPVLAVSISPKHDTYPMIERQGWMTISVLAGDQVEEGQYFSYPGRRFRHLGDYFDEVDGKPVVRGCVVWLYAEVVERHPTPDHVLFLVRVVATGEGRLDEPPLTYSSRRGWRVAGPPARHPGESVRDRLLRRLDEDQGVGKA